MLPHILITLVQTDKAKYKAGQKVLFRVVTLKSDLTAEEGMVSVREGGGDRQGKRRDTGGQTVVCICTVSMNKV